MVHFYFVRLLAGCSVGIAVKIIESAMVLSNPRNSLYVLDFL